MPLNLVVDSTHDVTILRVDGHASEPDWTAAWLGIVLHPNRLATSRIVIDRRRSAVVDGATGTVGVAALAGPMLTDPEVVRIAILVSDHPGAVQGAQRMAAGLERHGFEVAAFRDPDSACTWVFDGDDLAPIPAPAPLSLGEGWHPAADGAAGLTAGWEDGCSGWDSNPHGVAPEGF